MAGISITLAGNFAKLDELKGKARTTAASIKNSFNKVAGSAVFQGLAVGATAAFAGITAAITKVIGEGGKLNDMMLRTGASGKGLVILQQAFANAGVAADKVPGALNKMQKALAGVNEEGEPTTQAFAKIGLSIQELLTLDPTEAFRRTAQAIAELPDPAQRAAAAMEIFGKAGGELLAVMNDPQAFAQARDQLGSYAAELAANAAEFDEIGDSVAIFENALKSLGLTAAKEVVPALRWAAEAMQALVDLSNFNPFLGEAGDKAFAIAKNAKLAADDPMLGKSRTEENAKKLDAQNAGFWEGKEKEKQDAIAKTAATERAAAEKQADADRKKAEAAKESRAAAAEEYRLENAILAARLKGDAARLAKLEREKAIREEMAKLEAAGFTQEEARKPAEAKVDAEKKANDAEEGRKQAMEGQRDTQEDLAGKLKDSRKELEDLEYQSSVGSISSMQRIGGGGGAVASGLDYQRQVADLQREANGYLRQLIEVSRTPPE